MNVAVPAILSLASGGGGLDAGVALALGGRARTVCFVENEVTAVRALAASMEAQLLDDAPVWSDLRTFNGAAWRGLVDGVIGGYPCQPFSVAGKRRGVDDPRHLWPYIAGIVRAVEPRWCFFENVGGHLRLGFREVAEELRGMGYRVAATLWRAEEVGAPHRRERLFIMANTERARWAQAGLGRNLYAGGESQAGSGAVGDAYLARLERRRGALGGGEDELPQWPPGPESDAWTSIPERWWPATPQPAVRGVAAGRVLARTDWLRILGNGVVPEQAAAAFEELAEAVGLGG